MRVAVFGGSFNPPHFGHAMVASWLKWANRADEVWLVPAFQHAFEKPLAPYGNRVAACTEVAALVGPFAHVSEIEATLSRPSYTINTLRALHSAQPTHAFQLLIGADNLAHVHAWREWSAILAEFSPIVVGRGGQSVADAPSFPDISSTEIRQRVQQGLPTDHLVPPSVLAAWRG